jgi:transcriptional regulator with XRE-family HTH domain
LENFMRYTIAEAARRFKGWTLYRLAGEMGMYSTPLYNWRDGKSFPTPKQLDKVAATLGCTVDDLIDYHAPAPQPKTKDTNRSEPPKPNQRVHPYWVERLEKWDRVNIPVSRRGWSHDAMTCYARRESCMGCPIATLPLESLPDQPCNVPNVVLTLLDRFSLPTRAPQEGFRKNTP